MSNYNSIIGSPETSCYYVKEAKKAEFTFKALCTSIRCTDGAMRVIKEVPRHTRECPDCSHSLVWKRHRVL